MEAIVAFLDWASDLSRSVVAVMYAYFDDSGTDAASPVAIMAGYMAHMDGWRKFEAEAKALFKKDGIPFFRAKLFDHKQQQFKGWTDARRLRFAYELYGIAREHVLRGISAGVAKGDFNAGKAQDHPKLPRLAPQTYALQIAISNLCRDGEVWAEIQKHGLHVVVESSNAVDAGMEQDFYRIAGMNNIQDHLRSISFAAKGQARALNLADYLAYYSHRFALTALHDSREGRTEFLNIAQDHVTTIMKLAEGFGPNPDFLAMFSRWRASQKKAS